MSRPAAFVLAMAAIGCGSLLRAQETRPPILNEIGWDQRLGRSVPADLHFRDETGRAVRLGDYFGKKPVVLTLNYNECPMLCAVALQGFVSALNVISLDAGKEFEIVTVSFDPRENETHAAKSKRSYMSRYTRPTAASGWHFLTGDAENIKALTRATGFRYAWDEQSRQFAHPAGIVVLTPEGRIARYLFGIEYAPRDLRLALVEASAGRIGTAVDRFVLYCYRYDPTTGRYGAAIMRILRTLGVLTVGALVAFVVVMRRRELRAAGLAPGRAS